MNWGLDLTEASAHPRELGSLEREFAAATLQVLFRRYRDTDTRVLVGEPILAGPNLPAAVFEGMGGLLTRLAVTAA